MFLRGMERPLNRGAGSGAPANRRGRAGARGVIARMPPVRRVGPCAAARTRAVNSDTVDSRRHPTYADRSQCCTKVSISPPPSPGSVRRCAGAVVVGGSHGGVYAGLSRGPKARACAVILNDAGIGKEQRGNRLPRLLRRPRNGRGHRLPCVGAHRRRRGRALLRRPLAMSTTAARAAGCRSGHVAAWMRRSHCAAPRRPDDRAGVCGSPLHVAGESRRRGCAWCAWIPSRWSRRGGTKDGSCCRGSHGGLVADQPHLAIRVAAAAAFFNDAGIGKDGAGVTRLPALDARGIAAATVAADERANRRRALDVRGRHREPCANDTARAAGIEPGMTARARR